MRVPARFLGAFKRGHRKTSREFIDEDFSYYLLRRILATNYEDKEALEALDYLTKFNNEFYKNVIRKDDPDAIHNTDELRRDCYARENARNRDIYSLNREKAESLENLEEYLQDTVIKSTED